MNNVAKPETDGALRALPFKFPTTFEKSLPRAKRLYAEVAVARKQNEMRMAMCADPPITANQKRHNCPAYGCVPEVGTLEACETNAKCELMMVNDVVNEEEGGPTQMQFCVAKFENPQQPVGDGGPDVAPGAGAGAAAADQSLNRAFDAVDKAADKAIDGALIAGIVIPIVCCLGCGIMAYLVFFRNKREPRGVDTMSRVSLL